MSEFDLLVDLHKSVLRQGPGSDAITKRALELIDQDLGKDKRIADIGCGTGAQTMILAQMTEAQITAVDLFDEFLHKLKERSERGGFAERITAVQASMDDLPFGNAEFDLVWSEGAIYIMGFERGVSEWKKFIKPGGYLAVSEIAWITDSRPTELEDYWNEHYPEIGTISEKIRILEKAGYSPVGHIVLPESCWIENYYEPLKLEFENFPVRHHNSPEAEDLIRSEKEEIEFYRRYKDYYSYGFFLAKRVN